MWVAFFSSPLIFSGLAVAVSGVATKKAALSDLVLLQSPSDNDPDPYLR